MKYINYIFNIACKVIVIGSLATYIYVSLKYKNIDDWFEKHRHFQGWHTVKVMLPNGSIGHTSVTDNNICPKDLKLKLKLEGLVFGNKRALYNLNRCYLQYERSEKLSWLLLAIEKDSDSAKVQFLDDYRNIIGSLEYLHHITHETFYDTKLRVKKRQENKDSFIPPFP